MKTIPNILSFSRIILSLALIFLPVLTIEFYIIYAIAGLTDIVDGFLARRLKAESRFGAIVDSIADVTLLVITVIMIYPYLDINVSYLVWIPLIFIVKLVSILIAWFRFKVVFIGHTILNKVTGGCLFIVVFLIKFSAFDFACLVVCLIASLAAIEEIAINLTSENVELNRKSFFRKM